MTEETKPTPRVLRRTETAKEPRVEVQMDANDETFSGTLSNGRYVEFREITAGDLLFMEKALSNSGDMERSLKLAARISFGEGRVTFEDLQKLKMRDLRVITDLVTQAGGTDDEDEDEFPND